MNGNLLHAILKVALLPVCMAATLASAGIGDVDLSFGMQGRLVIPRGFGGLARLPDGRLQMVAVEATQIRVRRLTADGRADPGFGEAGEMISPLAGREARVNKAIILPDGSAYYLLAEPVLESGAGWLSPARNPGRVLRLGADGRPDSAFASSGVLPFPLEAVPLSAIAELRDLIPQPDGTFHVLVAYSQDYYECESEVRILRFSAQGMPDAAFGTGGVVRLTPACGWPVEMALLPLNGGGLYAGSTTQILGLDGNWRNLPLSFQEWLQARGETRLVAAGNAIYSSNLAEFADGAPRRLVIARWNADLTLDRSFGPSGAGFVTIDVVALPGFKEASYNDPRLHLQALDPYLYFSYPLGRASDTPGAIQYGTLLARLDRNGNLDPDFGDSGFAFFSGYPGSLIEQSAGEVILGLDGSAIRLLASDMASPGVVSANLACDRPYTGILRETDGLREFRLSRDLGDSGELAVDFRLLGVSASIPEDLDARTTVAGTLSWKDGETAIRTFGVTVRDDDLPEGDETFDVEFGSTMGNPVMLCSRARLVISANDQRASAPVPPVSISGSSSSTAGEPRGGGGALGWSALGMLGALLWIRRSESSRGNYARGRSRARSEAVRRNLAPLMRGTAALLVLAVGQVGLAAAGVGDIDSTYGVAGVLPLDGSVLPDGRVLTARVESGTVRLVRYDVDGRKDTGYGSAGEATVPMPVSDGWITGLEPAADGSAYVVVLRAEAEASVSLGRITAQGSLDTRFGQQGWLRFPASAVDPRAIVSIEGITILADGGVAFVMRYWKSWCGIREVTQVLRPDGLTGEGLPAAMLEPAASPGPGTSLCWEYEAVDLRQLSNGMLRVATGGEVTLLQFDGPPVGLDLYRLPGGDPYLYSSNFPMKVEPDAQRGFDYVLREAPGMSAVELVRVRRDGSFDFSFGSGGRAAVDFRAAVLALKAGEPGFFGSPMAIFDGFVWATGGADNRIYVAVQAVEEQSPGESVLIARLRDDGALDTSFGRDGILRIPGFRSRRGIEGNTSDGSVLLTLVSTEANSSVIVRLQGSAAASPGLVSISGQDGNPVEGERINVYVSRSLGSVGAVSVNYRTIAGTATAGLDFESVSGALHWADGEEGTRQIEIPIPLDRLTEDQEDFTLVLEGATGGVTSLNKAWKVRVQERSPLSGQPAVPATPGQTTPPPNPGAVADGVGGGGSLGLGTLTALLLCVLRGWLRSSARLQFLKQG